MKLSRNRCTGQREGRSLKDMYTPLQGISVKQLLASLCSEASNVSQKPTGRYARLDGLVNSTRAIMFNDLNNLYTTVLENSLAWEKDEKDTFKGIFSLVLFGKSPLTDITINEILGLDWGKTEEFLS